MPRRKLLCKSDAEGLEFPGTGNFMTQVQQEMHILYSDNHSGERFLGTVVSSGLDRGASSQAGRCGGQECVLTMGMIGMQAPTSDTLICTRRGLEKSMEGVWN